MGHQIAGLDTLDVGVCPKFFHGVRGGGDFGNTGQVVQISMHTGLLCNLIIELENMCLGDGSIVRNGGDDTVDALDAFQSLHSVHNAIDGNVSNAYQHRDSSLGGFRAAFGNLGIL